MVECSNKEDVSDFAIALHKREWSSKYKRASEKDSSGEDKEENANEVTKMKKKRVLKVKPWEIDLIKKKFEFVGNHQLRLEAKDVGKEMEGSGITSKRYPQILEKLGATRISKKVLGKTDRYYTGVQLRQEEEEDEDE